ncbi:MAG: protein kinase domain-containing protein, partial [Planctomycetota bacterium]
MRAHCPHCGSELEVPAGVKEATCTFCQQQFSVLAEADTLAEPPPGAVPSGEAPAPGGPMVRVNCRECTKEFTIPLGEMTGLCPHCETPYSATGPEEDAKGDVHTAKTVVTGARSSARPEPSQADDASLRWMRLHFGAKYEILEFISRGAMGAVYKVRQKQPSRVFALKLMLAGTFSSARHRKRFEREAQAVAELKHPAIVPVYEYGELGGQPYFTMEFVEGADLATYVRRGGLSREQICRMMVRVCDAIDYAHRHGVIHRDLKPGNIMVDTINRPRLLDFGLSRASVADEGEPTLLTMSGELLGTPRYMSPEQALGKPREVDERTDVYALGLILYELIVGVLPYPIDHVHGLRALDVIRSTQP